MYKYFLLGILLAFIIIPLKSFSVEGELYDTYKTYNKVELRKIAIVGSNDAPFGSDIIVVNNESFPIEVTIKLTDNENMLDGLLSDVALVHPGETVYLGWVVLREKGNGGSWSVNWSVQPHKLVSAKSLQSLPTAPVQKPPATTSSNNNSIGPRK